MLKAKWMDVGFSKPKLFGAMHRPKEGVELDPDSQDRFDDTQLAGRWKLGFLSTSVKIKTIGLLGTCFNNMLFCIYIYTYRKERCQVPIFPRFWKCSVFATSCSILYVHIPVMVLLEIHTDCQTSSEVAKECPKSHEDSQGKGRRKNKHNVYIYIYIWLPLGGEVAKKREFFLWASPLS